MSRVVRAELLTEVLGGQDPLAFANSTYTDHGYKESHQSTALLQALFRTSVARIGAPLDFYVEAGSMLGNSLLKTGRVAASLGILANLTLVAIDPFVGDVNMWYSEAPRLRKRLKFSYLRFQRGQPTIYERFLANVAGYPAIAAAVLPLRTTAVVGLSLFPRLLRSGRLSRLPQAIYLDSSHEEGETFMELATAWRALPPGGVLFGDDFEAFPGVRADVLTFAACLPPATPTAAAHLSQIGSALLKTEGRSPLAPCSAASLRELLSMHRGANRTGRLCARGGRELLRRGNLWLFVKDERRHPNGRCGRSLQRDALEALGVPSDEEQSRLE